MTKEEEGTSIRLVKRVAHLLNLSRRSAERLIQNKGILVDGILIYKPEYRVSLTARVEGQLCAEQSVPLQVLLYHKPVGEICSTSVATNRPTVFARLPVCERGRWIMVGRLDINTSGLLLFTTDGDLAYRLMHPKYQLDREYMVRVRGRVTEAITRRLKMGVRLADGMARFNDLVAHQTKPDSANQWFSVVVQSGRYRMVRRLWESQRLQVSRLMRIRYANLVLPPAMRSGEYHILNKKTMRSLMNCVGY